MSSGFNRHTDSYENYVSLSIQITGKFCGSHHRFGSIRGSTHTYLTGAKPIKFQKKLYESLIR